jgi:ABC-2 type transport system ATP-binding protein
MAEDPTRTVILTTHYMQEADDLCDRIAIVNHGQVVIEGTPESLKHEVQRDVVVDLQLEPGDPLLDRLRAVDGVGAASVREEDGVDRFSLLLSDDAVLTHVISAVERSGRRVAGLAKRQPTLEDAFVKLVGRSMDEEEGTE